MLYETRPDRNPEFAALGFVDIIIDGRRAGGCHKDYVVAHLAHFVSVHYQHNKEIADEVRKGSQNIVVVNRMAYSIGSELDYPKGYGGRLWEIAFFDGRRVVTTSLWCLGDVPDSWEFDIPDNATFVKGGVTMLRLYIILVIAAKQDGRSVDVQPHIMIDLCADRDHAIGKGHTFAKQKGVLPGDVYNVIAHLIPDHVIEAAYSELGK